MKKNRIYFVLVIFIVISISLVWSQQMQQDTALRPDLEKSSFWSSDFEEPKGLMVAYRLPSTPMLVSMLLTKQLTYLLSYVRK